MASGSEEALLRPAFPQDSHDHDVTPGPAELWWPSPASRGLTGLQSSSWDPLLSLSLIVLLQRLSGVLPSELNIAENKDLMNHIKEKKKPHMIISINVKKKTFVQI